MSQAVVECAIGLVTIDLESGEAALEGAPEHLPERPTPELGLPLVIDADRHGSTVVAVVERRPPLVVSSDGGATWRESGAGLPPGRAVAISPEHPDHVVYAGESRLYLSRDGGRFWSALDLELPSITSIRWTSD